MTPAGAGALTTPSLVQRHPAVRWLVPFGLVAAVVIAATGVLRAGAASEDTGPLPVASAPQLLSAVAASSQHGYSGTVVSRLSLGLPALPELQGTGATDASMMAMLTGSRTLQVWCGGADRQRVALLGATDESDVFRDGRDVWQWTSVDRTAVHTVLPADGARPAHPVPTDPSTLTPAAVVSHLLDRLAPTTRVTVENEGHDVAGRRAYDLVLTPREATTTIASVRIAVDGDTKVPLGVQVYARGRTSPSLDIAYSTIRFATPPATVFSFSPPSNATVRTVHVAPRATASRPHVATTGAGWATVWSVDTGRAPASLGGLGAAFAPVAGSWGTGKLLHSDLVNVLLLPDGRVLGGAVAPDVLFAAAAR